jgi:hypothetical protein
MRRFFVIASFTLGVVALIAGVLISRTDVTESKQFGGPTLHCGTAFDRDEDAARQYQVQQVADVLKGLGSGGLEVPTAGPIEVWLDGTKPANLDAECDKALSTRRSWSISLWFAAVALLFIGVVTWTWNSGTAVKIKTAAGRVIEGARFPRWMRQCPDWVIAALTLAAGFTGLFTSIVGGLWRVIWFVVTAGLMLAAASIAIARDGERRRQERWIKDAEASHRESLRALLGHQLHNLLHVVAEAVSAGEVTERRMLAQSARVAILAAAANLVGQKAEHGTRANLFKLDHEQEVMELAPMGFSGRGERSERVFRPGDDTYEATMNRKGTFVADVNEDVDNEGDTLGYETYITYPVHVPNRIHGVLTVDCLHKGELVEDDDVPMMSVLARLIAITYECEKYQRART